MQAACDLPSMNISTLSRFYGELLYEHLPLISPGAPA